MGVEKGAGAKAVRWAEPVAAAVWDLTSATAWLQPIGSPVRWINSADGCKTR